VHLIFLRGNSESLLEVVGPKLDHVEITDTHGKTLMLRCGRFVGSSSHRRTSELPAMFRPNLTLFFYVYRCLSRWKALVSRLIDY
jgi:hypothetical protein